MRETFSSSSGFALAAIGSAVGLGNMWRFSYLTAEYGGAAFLVLYIALTVFVGIPVLLAELSVGRGAGKGPIDAMKHFGGKRWSLLGVLFVVTGFLILSYYSVVAGWTARYGWESLVGSLPDNPASHFEQISQGIPAIIWHLGFMAITVTIVASGIRKGIERTSLIMMPILFLVVLGIAFYGSTLDGAASGYRYYLDLNWKAALRVEVFTAAAGPAFFSLSLGMGAILTYASYLKKEESITRHALVIAVADFGVAFLAGLMVFPLIFALGLSTQIIGTVGTENDVGSIGALFITLPEAFKAMGSSGYWIGTLFFLALSLGALTSAISILEVNVTSAMELLSWSRKKAALLSGALISLVGLAPAWRIEILGIMDALAGNIFLVVGGFALSLFVGWKSIESIRNVDLSPRLRMIWIWLIRVPVPIVLSVVTFYSVMNL